MNEQRADWIADSISSFAEEVMSGEISQDTICDFICNMGHYAKRELSLSKQDVLAIYENGIGSWIAENDDPNGEPEDNAKLRIMIG